MLLLRESALHRYWEIFGSCWSYRPVPRRLQLTDGTSACRVQTMPRSRQWLLNPGICWISAGRSWKHRSGGCGRGCGRARAAYGIAAECVTEPRYNTQPRYLSAKLLIQPCLGKSPFLMENGEWLSGWQIIWWVCGNCKTLHLPEKWHQLSTRRFQRGKLIYGRNAHKSCYFLMGFGSLFLTPCFEMYPTAYSINEFKHSDFLISRNHSSLGSDFFFGGIF